MYFLAYFQQSQLVRATMIKDKEVLINGNQVLLNICKKVFNQLFRQIINLRMQFFLVHTKGQIIITAHSTVELNHNSSL